MKKSVCFFILLSSLSTLSYADDCERPRNVFDELYCARKIFFSLDDDLNKYYKLLRAELNDAQKKLLKKSQLAWIKNRDTSCTIPGTNGSGSVIVSCAVKKTRQRLQFLQERYRECQAVGCMESKL